MDFAGTSVVSGTGRGLVTAPGGRTQFGAIAHSLVEKAPPTEFEQLYYTKLDAVGVVA